MNDAWTQGRPPGLGFLARPRAHRASALALVLACLPFIALVALLMLSNATLELQNVNSYWNAQQAQLLARSAVTTGYAELTENQAYGQDRSQEVRYKPDFTDDPTCYGLCTFRVGDASVPYSTNNYQGESSVEGYDHSVVPKDCVQLVGVGHYRGLTRTWTVFLGTAPFDRALSSSGAIISHDGLLVGALKDTATLKADLGPDDLNPTTLVSNGTDNTSGAPLQISGQAQIYGDLKSAGDAQIAPSVKISQGKVIPNAKPEALPSIEVSKYDPQGRPGLQVFSKPSYDALKTISGYARASGSVTFQQGVTLTNGVLYVDGDLEIDGPLQGQGAVFCTGKVTVRGGADLSTTNHAAIVAAGDVRILGNGSSRSSFNGLIWTGGQGGFSDQPPDQDLLVQDVTVEGCVVSAGHGTAGDGSQMVVDRSRVLFQPTATNFSMNPGFSGQWPIPVNGQRAGNGTLSLAPVTSNNKTFTPGPAYFAGLGRQPQASDFVLTDSSGQTYQANNGQVPSELSTAFIQAAQTQGANWQAEINQVASATNSNGETFQLDLNQFLQASDRLKLLMRKV